MRQKTVYSNRAVSCGSSYIENVCCYIHAKHFNTIFTHYTIQRTYFVNTDTVMQRNETSTQIRISLELQTPNMAALVKQLLEADGFLHNVQSLPSFRRVQELQFQKLKDYMNKKTIDDQSFAESSHAVEKMKHFDQQQKQQLQRMHCGCV